MEMQSGGLGCALVMRGGGYEFFLLMESGIELVEEKMEERQKFSQIHIF